jgi:pectate lyase
MTHSNSVMKSCPLIILSILAALVAPAFTLASDLVGWASVEAHGLKTTTGGGQTAPVTVTTLEELKRFLSDDAPQVVVVSGKIATGPKALEIRSNKTLMGADKHATIHGGLSIRRASNIIVRNLNIQGAGVGNDPADAIAARESHHLWFDHLNVWDSRDGNLDLTVGSDYLTVSWCKFWYTDASNDHRLSCLVGNGSTAGETDMGKNRATYHHNWFADLVRERMPRVLFGQAHIFNNLYTCEGNNYCIGCGSFASVLIEGNYFKGVKNPHKFADGNHAFITAKGNIYEATEGKQETGLGGTEGPNVEPFTQPPYVYTADAVEDLPAIIMKAAGPQ